MNSAILCLRDAYRIKAPVDDLIVVEGFTGVWWLFQNDLPDVVGTMRADCSEKQTELIVSLVKPAGTIWIMPDGTVPGKQTDAGLRCAQSLLMQISPHRAV